MNAAIPSPVSKLPAWRTWLTVLAVNAAIWLVLTTIGALNTMNDELRFRGVEGSPWLIFKSTCRTSLVLASLSFILYLGFNRWPAIVANAWMIACGYVTLLLALLPLQLVFVAKTYLPGDSWVAVGPQVEAFARFIPYLHWTSITAVYFAVVAVKIWQQSHARAHGHRRRPTRWSCDSSSSSSVAWHCARSSNRTSCSMRSTPSAQWFAPIPTWRWMASRA
jgi:two-component system, LytTR family, sensor histidine kinase AlgZ